MIPEGTRIEAPDGEGGYTLTADWFPGIPWNKPELFEAYGSAARPVAGMMMPSWLDNYFRERLTNPTTGK